MPSTPETEYDADEYPPLQPNFSVLQKRILKELRRQIVSWEKLERGRSHEIFLVKSLDGWACIARFARYIQSTEKIKSEVATMRYVRSHTEIPVPEVYLYDASTSNDVGAQYIVMQRMEGTHLYAMWDRLSLEHQKAALTQIASILGHLSALKFDRIGSLTINSSTTVEVDPLMWPQGAEVDGTDSMETIARPSFSTTQDFLDSFITHWASDSEPQVKPILSQVSSIIAEYCASQSYSPFICAPFRLIHADFDGQNMLFSDPLTSEGAPPTLMSVIDWEYAYVGPLYFLYEYPLFIQDCDFEKQKYERNLQLRQHFVRALRAQFPAGSQEHEEAKECFPKAKCSTLNEFHRLLMMGFNWNVMKGLRKCLEDYIKQETNGTNLVYSGRLDYVPDPDTD